MGLRMRDAFFHRLGELRYEPTEKRERPDTPISRTVVEEFNPGS